MFLSLESNPLQNFRTDKEYYIHVLQSPPCFNSKVNPWRFPCPIQKIKDINTTVPYSCRPMISEEVSRHKTVPTPSQCKVYTQKLMKYIDTNHELRGPRNVEDNYLFLVFSTSFTAIHSLSSIRIVSLFGRGGLLRLSIAGTTVIIRPQVKAIRVFLRSAKIIDSELILGRSIVWEIQRI